MKALAVEGRMVNIAFQKGSKVEINLMPMMLKRLSLMGSTLRARPAAEKAVIAAAVTRTVWPWVEAGKVKPVLDSTFPLSEAGAAHTRMEASTHIGKILLIP